MDLTEAGIQSNNWDEINNTGSLAEQMVDPGMYDFRPRPNSAWVDAGVVIAGTTFQDGTFVPGGINDDFLARRPISVPTSTGIQTIGFRVT